MATAATYTRLGRPVPTALAVDEQLSLDDEARSA
jgi:hypothetical protein